MFLRKGRRPSRPYLKPRKRWTHGPCPLQPLFDWRVPLSRGGLTGGTGFPESVDVVVHDTVLGLNVPYEGKPLANNLRILVLSPLVVVPTCPTRPELWLAFDEVVCLELADRGRIPYA